MPAGTLGKMVVKDLKSGVVFNLSSGWDEKKTKEIWQNQQKYMGKIVKYKFQAIGTLIKPRIPICLGFRDPSDAIALE